MNAFRLHEFRWNGPDCSIEIQVAPAHSSNFAAPLACQNQASKERTRWIFQSLRYTPDFGEFALFQHAFATLILRWRFQFVSRGVVDITALNAPAEKALHHGQRLICQRWRVAIAEKIG
jgi:hypothetical protein